MKQQIRTAIIAIATFGATFCAHVGEIGHFNGGVMNWRDWPHQSRRGS